MSTERNGKRIKATRKMASKVMSAPNKNRSKNMSTDFTKIPIPIENPTRPLRYSFFNGLKKVLMRRGSEKISKKLEFILA